MFNERHNRRDSRWINVVFMQDSEADTVFDIIDRDGVAAALANLQRWDYGDETTDAALENGYVYDTIPAGPTDRIFKDDASRYAMTYSTASGYVSLLRRYPDVTDRPQTLTRGSSAAQLGRAHPPLGPWTLESGRPSLAARRSVSM